MFFGKSFENVCLTDITNLIENNVAEMQNLEYKSEVWGNSDSNVREMLKDISAIANAFGGYILIGIPEDDNGLPGDEIQWLTDEEAEMQRDRIIRCCISSIEPRIPGLKVGIIHEEGQGAMIKIFVPRSTRRPHMVLRSADRFFIRHDRQVSRMSIEEIREACLRTENLQQSIRDFIEQRKDEIRDMITDNTTLVIGAAPLTIGTDFIDIDDQSIRSFLQNPPDQRRAGFNMGFNQCRPEPTLQGLKIGPLTYKTITLMRNGYYEIMVPLEGEHYLTKVREQESFVIKHFPLVEYVVNFLRCLKLLRQMLGIEETFITFLCIYNVNKHGFVRSLRAHFGPIAGEVEVYAKRNLAIGPQAIYNLENPDGIAKDILGKIWNAHGFETTSVPYFTNDTFECPYENR